MMTIPPRWKHADEELSARKRFFELQVALGERDRLTGEFHVHYSHGQIRTCTGPLDHARTPIRRRYQLRIKAKNVSPSYFRREVLH